MALWLNCPIMISYQKTKKESWYNKTKKKILKKLLNDNNFSFFWAFDRYLQSIKYNSA